MLHEISLFPLLLSRSFLFFHDLFGNSNPDPLKAVMGGLQEGEPWRSLHRLSFTSREAICKAHENG
jgi:hypothetical protein